MMPGRTSWVMVVALPAPKASPEVFLTALPSEPAVVWIPPTGPSYAGVGVAARIDLGRGGIRAMRERGKALLERTISLGPPNAPTPRLFGGVAFDVRRRAGTRWAGFPPGALILPRWTYVRDGRSAWLLLALEDAERQLRRQKRRWLGESDRIARILEGARMVREEPSRTARLESEDERTFSRLHQRALDAIVSGRARKIVIARRLSVRAGAPLDGAAALTRLRSRHRGCYGFALRLGGATFLGASPERLVGKQGMVVHTEALAGSSPATPAGARALRSSRKEAAEHAFVVRALREALAPYCRGLRVVKRAGIRRLPAIHHLETRLSGTLRTGTHVLDLVGALHPTPAVGGTPRDAALGWIARNEEPRGWYAGAFGCIDAKGDGEFAVTIRSGLVRGRRADVWAGAGIVNGSRVTAELAEIRRKRSGVLRALGVVEP